MPAKNRPDRRARYHAVTRGLGEVLDTMDRIGESIAEYEELGQFVMEAPKVRFVDEPSKTDD